MSPRTSVRGGCVAVVIVAGLVAASAITAHASGESASPDLGRVVNANAELDGRHLLGSGLLGLDGPMVEALVASDPHFARQVSQGLRSDDPHAIEATLAAIGERVRLVEAGTGQGLVVHQTGHSVVVLAQTGVRSAPVQIQSQTYGIAVKFQDFVPPQAPARTLSQAHGLEMEQLVSAIHVALAKE